MIIMIIIIVHTRQHNIQY